MRKYIVLVFISLLFPAFPAFSQTVDAANIALSWVDTSTRESSFKIERSLAVAGPFAEIVSLPANTQSYIDSGLAENQNYSYQMRACNAGGCSPYTPIVSAITKVPVPAVPTNFKADPQ